MRTSTMYDTRIDEPYPEPVGVASHFCETVGATLYCDFIDCPYCGADETETEDEDCELVTDGGTDADDDPDRAEERERDEQEAEQMAVEWPAEIGRYHLVRTQSDPGTGVYKTLYTPRQNPFLGPRGQEDVVTARFYDHTQKYHIHATGLRVYEAAYSRKESAIEGLREVIADRSAELAQIETDADAEPDPETDSDSQRGV